MTEYTTQSDHRCRKITYEEAVDLVLKAANYGMPEEGEEGHELFADGYATFNNFSDLMGERLDDDYKAPERSGADGWPTPLNLASMSPKYSLSDALALTLMLAESTLVVEHEYLDEHGVILLQAIEILRHLNINHGNVIATEFAELRLASLSKSD